MLFFLIIKWCACNLALISKPWRIISCVDDIVMALICYRVCYEKKHSLNLVQVRITVLYQKIDVLKHIFYYIFNNNNTVIL